MKSNGPIYFVAGAIHDKQGFQWKTLYRGTLDEAEIRNAELVGKEVEPGQVAYLFDTTVERQLYVEARGIQPSGGAVNRGAYIAVGFYAERKLEEATATDAVRWTEVIHADLERYRHGADGSFESHFDLKHGYPEPVRTEGAMARGRLIVRRKSRTYLPGEESAIARDAGWAEEAGEERRMGGRAEKEQPGARGQKAGAEGRAQSKQRQQASPSNRRHRQTRKVVSRKEEDTDPRGAHLLVWIGLWVAAGIVLMVLLLLAIKWGSVMWGSDLPKEKDRKSVV